MANPHIAQLIKKIKSLPQLDTCWELTVQLGRSWVTTAGCNPYRPYLSFVHSSDDKVIRTEFHKERPSIDDLFDELLRAMKKPAVGGGRAGRPQAVYIDDESLAVELTPLLAGLGVGCEYRALSTQAASAVASLYEFLNRDVNSVPALVSIPGISDALLGRFYELTAEYFKVEPWRWFTDEYPIEIRYPADADASRCAVVMGGGGEVYGIAVYDSVDVVRELYSNPNIREVRASSLAVIDQEIYSMSFDELDAIEAHHWPIASEDFYPSLVRIQGGRMEMILPSLEDVIFIEGVLAGILTYVRDHKKVAHEHLAMDELTMPIDTVDGPSTIYLRFPAFE